MSLTQLPPDFKTLEEQIVARVQESARQFYAEAVAAFQERWLSERRAQWSALRWRTIDQVTPFGLLRLPMRVLRSRAEGHYLTLSKVLLAPKATRLLSPAVGEAGVGGGDWAQLSTGGRGTVALVAQ